ncbi:Gfo/Idh/MocA family oxidoreductase [Campylobacter sp. 46490-21]|nr:Gfo/Idh/MocA family oxidoreductase [Campylobacter magnus]MDD0847612.1 Gfo/Idh/MocA family oxidoreductase [Campylobacter magnus]
MIEKHKNECEYVNGICIAGICSDNDKLLQKIREIPTKSYDELLDVVDALYIVSNPKKHYEQIKKALLEKKHVLCDSPITLSIKEHKELNELAKKQDCILMDSLKTAYSTAYARLLLLVKSGKIGQVYSVDTTCTSLTQMNENSWNSICEWGPVALLPIFDIFGVDYKSKNIISHLDKNGNDEFTKISFIYKNAVASAKVGKGVKSEGELVISGTKGYIYVPAPWWKTDYFEIRYENASENKRYFYQLDGEGIRYELSAFVRSIEAKKNLDHVGKHISEAFCKIIEDFNNKVDFIEI